MLEGHGDDIYAYEGLVKYNFSSNILSGVDHSGLTSYLSRCHFDLGRYPKPLPLSLEKELAEWLGVPPECVMVTNGATDAIYTIAFRYSGSDSMIISPTFSEYEDACQMYGHRISYADSLKSLSERGYECVWLCNPNNPTGMVTDKDTIIASLRDHPDVVHVIDQSYSDYTTKTMFSPMDAVSEHKLLLIGSFTKQFSVPGLRIGYVVGNRELITAMKKSRMPWAVSEITSEAARYLIRHSVDYKIDSDKLNREALRICISLRKLGIVVRETDCNFLLCRLPYGTAAELKEWLVKTHGILIRDASNFRGLTKHHFRVAAQRKDENDLLVTAIAEWLKIIDKQ